MSPSSLMRLLLILSSISYSFSGSPANETSNETIQYHLEQRRARLERFNPTFTDTSSFNFFQVLNNAVKSPRVNLLIQDLIISSYPHFESLSEVTYFQPTAMIQEDFQVLRDNYINCWNTSARIYYRSSSPGFHPVIPEPGEEGQAQLKKCIGKSKEQLLPHSEIKALLGDPDELNPLKSNRNFSSSNDRLWRNITHYFFNCVPAEKVSVDRFAYQQELLPFEHQINQWLDLIATANLSIGEYFRLQILRFSVVHHEEFRKTLDEMPQPSEILQDLPFFPTNTSTNEFNNTAIYRATILLLANESASLLQEGLELLQDALIDLIIIDRAKPEEKSRYIPVRYEFNMSEVTLLDIAKIGGMLWDFRYVTDANYYQTPLKLDNNGVLGYFSANPQLSEDQRILRIRWTINNFIKLYWKVMKTRGIVPKKMEEQDQAVVCEFQSMDELTKYDRIRTPPNFDLNSNGGPHTHIIRKRLEKCTHCLLVDSIIDEAIGDIRERGNHSIPKDLPLPLVLKLNDFLKDASKAQKEKGLNLIKYLYEYSWAVMPLVKGNPTPSVFFVEEYMPNVMDKRLQSLLSELQIFGGKLDVKYLNEFGQETFIKNGSEGSFQWVGPHVRPSSYTSEHEIYVNIKYILNAIVELIFEVVNTKK
ncbi:uncharacterized protein [Fopius arisanus]|uniref:Dennd5b_0 protein n=1 Tax=Fopius arisanus TaxID=64838 RepID=A0A0C9RKX1_9HYME|nr:PREDICTED: uncharacterized protein LOC105263136 [Fopius arisanus]